MAAGDSASVTIDDSWGDTTATAATITA
jgi:hypothetical protein